LRSFSKSPKERLAPKVMANPFVFATSAHPSVVPTLDAYGQSKSQEAIKKRTLRRTSAVHLTGQSVFRDAAHPRGRSHLLAASPKPTKSVLVVDDHGRRFNTFAIPSEERVQAPSETTGNRSRPAGRPPRMPVTGPHHRAKAILLLEFVCYSELCESLFG